MDHLLPGEHEQLSVRWWLLSFRLAALLFSSKTTARMFPNPAAWGGGAGSRGTCRGGCGAGAWAGKQPAPVPGSHVHNRTLSWVVLLPSLLLSFHRGLGKLSSNSVWELALQEWSFSQLPTLIIHFSIFFSPWDKMIILSAALQNSS